MAGKIQVSIRCFQSMNCLKCDLIFFCAQLGRMRPGRAGSDCRCVEQDSKPTRKACICYKAGSEQLRIRAKVLLEWGRWEFAQHLTTQL